MRRAKVMDGMAHELVTIYWPLEDDETRCLDLAESLLSRLVNPLDRDRVLQ